MANKKIPIHKFNGGLGATLCHKCSKIVTEGFTSYMYCRDCDPIDFLAKQEQEMEKNKHHKYTLRKEEDGSIKYGDEAIWIEWNKDRTFKLSHHEPEIGRSLILDGNRMNYTWLTTQAQEILEVTEDRIRFRTKNSTYELIENKKNTYE
jgi:hypothetical protein